MENPIGTAENANILAEIRKEVEDRERMKGRKPKKVIKQKKNSFKVKAYGILGTGVVSIIAVGFIGINGINLVSEFTQRKEIKTQPFKVEVQMPRVYIQDKEPLYVPVSGGVVLTKANEKLDEKGKEEIIRNSDYSKILAGIRMLESSNNSQRDQSAHHVDCAKVGMSNEFGYRALDDYCFSTFEESVKVVSEWIDKHINSMGVNNLLCLYSGGNAVDTCNYSVNYHELDKQGSLAVK